MLDAMAPIAAGLVLGVVFYGGLWWTIRHMVARPLALMGSALLRTGVVMGGMYWVADGRWTRIVLCLIGFLVARLGVTWATRLRSPSPAPSMDIHHAP